MHRIWDNISLIQLFVMYDFGCCQTCIKSRVHCHCEGIKHIIPKECSYMYWKRNQTEVYPAGYVPCFSFFSSNNSIPYFSLFVPVQFFNCYRTITPVHGGKLKFELGMGIERYQDLLDNIECHCRILLAYQRIGGSICDLASSQANSSIAAASRRVFKLLA